MMQRYGVRLSVQVSGLKKMACDRKWPVFQAEKFAGGAKGGRLPEG
jgi:hypothetical protein